MTPDMSFIRRTLLFTLIASLCVLPVSCGNNAKTEKETSTQSETPPTVPPQSSMAMDFDSFPKSKALPGPTGVLQATIAGAPNFTFAAVNVGVWNLIITIGLVVPVTAFCEAFNHAPVLQADGSWLWSYSKTINNSVYVAKLYGKVGAGQVQWDMYLTKQGEFADFNWFSGTANTAGTAGTWTLKDKPANPVDTLSIVWNRNITAGTGNITYTNIVSGGPENGGYISYGTDATTDPAYNAYYTIYNKSADSLINIEWDRTSKAGRVKSPKAFGDSVWHSWNSSLQDS